MARWLQSAGLDRTVSRLLHERRTKYEQFTYTVSTVGRQTDYSHWLQPSIHRAVLSCCFSTVLRSFHP
jgi:hypothetical protein